MFFKKRAGVIIAAVSAFSLFCAVFAALVLTKTVTLNHPSSESYPVRGIDVSEYQGEIDWEEISKGQDFAYIKATEGSSYTDKKFSENIENVMKANIIYGAYHFFSFDSPGINQAENFIKNVPKRTGMLPPAADVEFYGKYKSSPPEKESAENQIREFLSRLEAHYGVKPVIYATRDSYKYFFSEGFEEYPLWIRNVYFSPQINMSGKWTFWQYSDRGQTGGFFGEEKYIDLNVFNGGLDKLREMCIK